MIFLTFLELEKKVIETYQNSTPQSVKTTIYQKQRLFKIQYAESNINQKVLTDEIFRYESKFNFEDNKYLFEGKKAVITSLKQGLAIQKGLLKPEIVNFADFYDLDKLVLNPHYGSVICTFDSQMTAKDMLLLDVFYLSWLKRYNPSVLQAETTPSVSKPNSKMRDSTKVKYDSYMLFFERRLKKGDKFDSAMSKTLEKFKISNDTFDKAFNYYKSLKNN